MTLVWVLAKTGWRAIAGAARLFAPEVLVDGGQLDGGSRGQAIENLVDLIGVEVLAADRRQCDRAPSVSHDTGVVRTLGRRRRPTRRHRRLHVALLRVAALAVDDFPLPRVGIIVHAPLRTLLGVDGAVDRLTRRAVRLRLADLLHAIAADLHATGKGIDRPGFLTPLPGVATTHARRGGAGLHPNGARAGRPFQDAARAIIERDLIGDVEEAVHGERSAGGAQPGQRGLTGTGHTVVRSRDHRKRAIIEICTGHRLPLHAHHIVGEGLDRITRIAGAGMDLT